MNCSCKHLVTAVNILRRYLITGQVFSFSRLLFQSLFAIAIKNEEIFLDFIQNSTPSKNNLTSGNVKVPNAYKSEICFSYKWHSFWLGAQISDARTCYIYGRGFYFMSVISKHHIVDYKHRYQ